MSKNYDYDDYTIRKKLTLYGWAGVPMFFIVNIIASFLMVIGWAIVQALGGPALITFDNGEPAIADMTNLMLVSTIVGMFAYPLIWLFPFARRQHKFVHGYGIKDLQDKMHTRTVHGAWLKAIGIGAAIGIGVFIVMGLIQLALSPVLDGRDQSDTTTTMIVDSIKNAGTGSYVIQGILVGLMACLIGPIMEELLFRGFIGMSFRDSIMFRKKSDKIRMWIIIILSGALFGVMHMQPGDPIVSIATMLLTGSLGAFLSWMSLYKFKTVVPGMATHAVYNSITILLAVLAGIGM